MIAGVTERVCRAVAATLSHHPPTSWLAGARLWAYISILLRTFAKYYGTGSTSTPKLRWNTFVMDETPSWYG